MFREWKIVLIPQPISTFLKSPPRKMFSLLPVLKLASYFSDIYYKLPLNVLFSFNFPILPKLPHKFSSNFVKFSLKYFIFYANSSQIFVHFQIICFRFPSNIFRMFLTFLKDITSFRYFQIFLTFSSYNYNFFFLVQ